MALWSLWALGALVVPVAPGATAAAAPALIPGQAAGPPGPAGDAPPLGDEPIDAPGAGAAVRPVDGEVVQVFAPPDTPFGPGHRGVDLIAGPGDEVRAALDGVVAFAGLVAGRGWVTLDHGGGLQTTYGVLAERRVTAGQAVRAGDVIGVLGPEADHLDWGARVDGSYVDPLSLLGVWEVHLTDPDRLVEPAIALVGALPPAPAPGGWTWPTAGRPGSGFGPRIHPITGVRRLHAGVDIGAPTGQLVVAATGGVVLRAGWAGGYGNLVEVAHGGGITTRYAHNSALLVRAGQPVAQGQPLSRIGSTGLSTGPHLHFEVRTNGVPHDPLAYY